MEIRIVSNSIPKEEIQKLAAEQFGEYVKIVVDVEKNVAAFFGDLHADEEALLLSQGSKQENLWGINFYPARINDGRIEFDSMINVRPSQGNRTRGVENQAVREKILGIVNTLIAE